VDKYKDRSLSLACSIIGSKQDAQDVLQDAFISAYRSLPKFDFKSSFSTWLYRIVVNTSYTALKRYKSRKTISIDSMPDHISTDMSSSYILKENERKEIINQVLHTLKPNESLVLKLYYLGEQNSTEIAGITGLSISNIKVLLHRARKKFHANLENLLGPDKKQLYE
jgi:RNA polymerase sigma-70 factor (ECF subfamily)